MLVEPPDLLAALRLPATATVECEPLGAAAWSAERVSIRVEGEPPRAVILRGSAEPAAAMNHLAVMEMLTRTGFASAPALLAIIGDIAVEEAVDGASALALVPPPGAAEAAIGALAGLHGLPVKEGLGWESTPEELLPDEEVPLHRLGFALREREAAREPFERMRRDLLAAPFGFMHGAAGAGNILLGRGRAWLVDFGHAGFGCQLFDVAAFLLTSGLEAPARRVLAMEYARRRGADPDAITALVDEAGILWGISELLQLPRRQIQALGDDAASEAIQTAASRIQRGLRAVAGDSEPAAALREALWPE
ncbi:MAG: hypothetical protein C0506_11610 [Anaerolinea sp.]|nr:hypothetical protein [Anaerolinea sp.]